MRLRERRDDPDARDDPGSASRGPAAKNKPATVVVTAPAEKEKEKEKKKSKPFGRNPARWLEKRLGEAAAFVEKSTTSVSSSSSRADAAADFAVADDPATRARFARRRSRRLSLRRRRVRVLPRAAAVTPGRL